MQFRQKHTVDSMSMELDIARAAGSAAEVSDLLLLIRNVQVRANDGGQLPGVDAARNRQGQRRFNRARGAKPGISPSARPRVGDRVRDPEPCEWTITETNATRADGITDDGRYRFAPFHLLTLVKRSYDGAPVVAPVATIAAPVPAPVTPTPIGAPPYAEALYHALWDVIDEEELTPDARARLEAALRAYEASAPT